MRKVRASMMALTRPSPCGVRLQGAAVVGLAAAASNIEHSEITARPQNLIVFVIEFMT
jgi:hypothetical protein